jgi:hypothetical protein
MDDPTQALIMRVVEEIVLEAKADWVGLWQIIGQFEPLFLDEATLRERTLDVVRVLLDRGFIAGDPIYSAHGFRPWPDQRPEAIIERIRSEWLALGRIPNIGDIVYFDLPA